MSDTNAVATKVPKRSPHEIEACIHEAVSRVFLDGSTDAINEVIGHIYDLAQERDELEAKLAAVREVVAQ